MSIKKPATNIERRVTADHITDLATALCNALNVRDSDGRNPLERMQSEFAGHPDGTDYERPNVKTSTMSDPTAATGMALERHGDTAQTHAKRMDYVLQTVNNLLEEGTDILSVYMTRPPMLKEAVVSALEEASKDPGCESCRRVTKHDGTRANETTRATTNCCTRVENGPVDQNTARLDKRYRLCRWCEDYVLAVVTQGSKLALHEAIPMRTARAHVNGERVFKPYDPKREAS